MMDKEKNVDWACSRIRVVGQNLLLNDIFSGALNN